MLFSSSLALFVLALSALAEPSDVLVVDRSGAAQFTQIQAAVLAARDGDTILVRPPTPVPVYQAVFVFGKSLTIVVDSATGFADVDGLRIKNLSPEQSVVVSGIQVNSRGSGIPPGDPSLWLQDDAGSVHLVRCRSTGYYGSVFSPALAIEGCSRPVALAACAFLGGRGQIGDEFPAGPGSPALWLLDSRATCFDTTFTGGRGGSLAFFDGGPGQGGAGALLEQASAATKLHAFHCAFVGGAGGDLEDCFSLPFVGGPGGDGLVLGALTAVRQRASTFAGGAGGIAGIPGSSTCSGPPGAPGVPVSGVGGLAQLAGAHVGLTSPTVGREGEIVTLTLEGTPGDPVYLVASKMPYPVTAGLLGASLVKVGWIQADGTLQVPYPLPEVVAGAENLWFQVFTRRDGLLTPGGFSVVTVLDSIY